MRLLLSLALLLGGLFPAPLLCGAVDYYVTPTDSSHPDCPTGELCCTIDHYASNESYFRDKENITMNFLPGTHNLTRDLRINDLKSLTVRGFESQADIYLSRGYSDSISILDVPEVTIEYLNVHNGGTTLYLKHLQVLLNVVVQHVSLYNTVMHVIASHAQGIYHITCSLFFSSQLLSEIVNFSDLNMSIDDSIFYSQSGQLMSVSIDKSVNVSFVLDNITTLDGNTGNRNPSIHDPSHDLIISPNRFIDSDQSHATICVLNSNFKRSLGTALFINAPQQNEIDIHISNTTISGHKAGGILFRLGFVSFERIHVTIEDCEISNNDLQVSSLTGGATGITIYGDKHLALSQGYPMPTSDFKVDIRNTIFRENHDLRGRPIVIWLFRVTNITIRDCEFLANEGTPIVAYYSDFTLSGNVSFRGNTATKGGAISLTSSHMYITKNSSVVFEDNSATDVGGAIFVEQPNVYLQNDLTTISRCFYQLPDWEEKGDYYLGFYNNTAKHGGEQIYGASLKSYCTVYTSNPLDPNRSTQSYQVDHIFHFEPESDTSVVSSEPTRICLCEKNGQYNECANLSYIFRDVSVHPGELFTLSATVVGSHFGSTTGTIYAQLLPHSREISGSLKSNQYSQGVSNYAGCTEVEYSVYSAHEQDVIILTATDGTIGLYGDRDTIKGYIDMYHSRGIIPTTLLTTPVYINVTLLPCPPGFNLTGDPPGCECYPIFGENHISCDVTSGRVIRNGTQFVTALFEQNKSTGVIVHNHCPFGYCKPQQVMVDLNTPDSQCAFNRSGILCGACMEGYSSVLGSSRCLQCENRYLALLLFFAVAGILLVLFIKVLNLTVAQGTINGLIFYANIVWANQSILYPDKEHVNGASVFFKTFIAWLNLDFGIETCFAQGLTGYWKTWLQFVFPFYIWAIAGVIILVSRHSSIMTKLFGNNAVPVLATLFLLSYSKLLRTIITAMSMTFLVEYPDGQKSTVWSFDGNIQFCGMPHVFLFIAALAALLILWLPYTSVLLSVQWLQKGSEYKVLRWVDKLKPIFDAYFAPFKDKHHYWVGVLLLVRGVLLITVALTEANMPTANLLALVTVAATLLAYTALTGNLYRKTYASLLDTLSLLNLVILGGGALYTELSGGNRAALVITSVGVALIQFVGIVLFHLWNLIKRCRSHKKHEEYEDLGDAARDQANEGLNVAGRDQVEVAGNGGVVVDYSKLREPLLEESCESHAMVAM